MRSESSTGVLHISSSNMPKFTKKTTVCLVITIIITIALIVGLSVGLTQRKHSSASVNSPVNPGQPYPSLKAAKGDASLIANDLTGVRSLLFDQSTGNLLALVKGTQQIVAISIAAPSSADYAKKVILDAKSLNLGLNHGLALKDGYLYASSASTVYRWKYSGNQLQSSEKIVENISGTETADTAAGHLTRTVVLDDNWMYVSVGSLANVDPNPNRSRIRRFPYKTFTGTSFDYQQGEIWADGLRNAVALTFDSKGRLWTAVNGPDDLDRPDLHDNLVQDSPIEPLILLDQPAGTFYGYPYCFTAGNFTQPFDTDPSVGKIYAWPTTMNDGTHTDAWCQNTANVKPPTAYIPAHSAPLSMAFHPSGDLYMTLHGSWNRDIPSGFSVVRLPFSSGGAPATQRVTERVLWLADQMCSKKAPNCFRPVGIALVDGNAYVSSDNTGEIVRITV